MREARQLWRQHSPVDPAAAEQLQGRFNALTGALQSRIDTEYARNVKEKKSLIERARALTGSAETRKAIDEVKRLQEHWKAVGPVSRDDDRKLWEEFRKQCDALFEKRQQEFATQNAALDSNKSQAISLCEEVEKIAQLSGQDLLEGAKKLARAAACLRGHRGIAERRGATTTEPIRAGVRALSQKRSLNSTPGCGAGLDSARSTSNAVRAYRLAVVRNADGAELKQAAEASRARQRA